MDGRTIIASYYSRSCYMRVPTYQASLRLFRRARWSFSAAVIATGLIPVAIAVWDCPVAAAQASQADPISAINQWVERRWAEKQVSPAAEVDDRAFARRVYLDLAGRIPIPSEVEAFLADPAADRRTKLVDRLLTSPDYAQRMRDVFDVVFIGRKQEGQRRRRSPLPEGLRGEWLAYLERSFAENRPWDRMVRDMLLSRPETPAEKGAVWFLFSRQDKYQDIAEAISPSVFGVQIQCAQCHDHPLAAEIKQSHYWGLVAFFNRGKNRITMQGPRVAESAIGGFANFANLSGESQPAELTFLGAPKIDEARPPDGVKEQDAPDLYEPKLDGAPADEPPVPRFSRRARFVEQVLRGNRLVARAAVNRFWALLMGRGLVHPVDKMDSQHPASHPELLDYLARDFEASGFDVRRLVRSLVLSRPYQLDSRPVPGAQPELFAYGLEKPLTAESLHRSLLVAATGKTEAGSPELRAELIETFPDVFPEENLSSLPQSMFLTNSPLFQQLVRPGGGNTAERLAAIADPAQRVREAFRIAYAREPAPDELRETVAYLHARQDRPQQATSQLWWALLAGAEFRFNH